MAEVGESQHVDPDGTDPMEPLAVERQAILEPCPASGATIAVTRSMTLNPSCSYTNVRFEIGQEGVVFDCNGATLRARAFPGLPGTIPGVPAAVTAIQVFASNVLVKACNIDGYGNALLVTPSQPAEFVWGLEVPGVNGSGPFTWGDLATAWLGQPPFDVVPVCQRHEALDTLFEQFRAGGTRNVQFSDVHITNVTGKGLYLYAVEHVTFSDGSIQGVGSSSSIYLGSHSKHIVIRDSRFDSPNNDAIRIDASAKNTVANNRFTGGGIIVFKNCWEHKELPTEGPRAQHAHGNVISGNRFTNPRTTDDRAEERIAVWIGSRASRNLGSWNCGDPLYHLEMPDKVKFYRDYAENTVVENNIFENGSRVRVEDDEAKVRGNKFSYGAAGERPASYIWVGSFARQARGEPVVGTIVANNTFMSAAQQMNVRFSFGSTPPVKAPVGWFEHADVNGASGWVRDPDHPQAPVAVLVYVDGWHVASGASNLLRTDVNAAEGVCGNHGFHIPFDLASFGSGTHEIRAYGIDVDGQINGELSNSPFLVYVAPPAPTVVDFVKHGNNGTVPCDTFCEGADWGEVGGCVGAVRSDIDQRLTCSTTPGLLDAGQLTCECVRGFLKHGNNGTVSCSTYCGSAVWGGGTGRCVDAVRSDDGQRLSCEDVPGFLGDLQLTCQCVP